MAEPAPSRAFPTRRCEPSWKVVIGPLRLARPAVPFMPTAGQGPTHPPEVGVGSPVAGVGEAGACERGGEGGRTGDMERCVVAEGATASAGGEDVVVKRVDDDGHRPLTGDLGGDRHGEGGKAVEVVGGAVERVD